MIDIDSLKHVEIFSNLSKIQLKLVSSYLKEERVSINQYIIHENTKGNCMYILYKGKVKITKKLTLDVAGTHPEEKHFITLTDKNKPSFGENGIVGVGKRTANVIATSECIMYKLSDKSYDSILKQDLEAGYLIMLNIAKTLASRLEQTDENIVKLATALSIAVFQS